MSNRPVAELAGILDPDVAFAFSLECADIELGIDLEREQRMYEAMGITTATNALGGNMAQRQSAPARRNEGSF